MYISNKISTLWHYKVYKNIKGVCAYVFSSFRILIQPHLRSLAYIKYGIFTWYVTLITTPNREVQAKLYRATLLLLTKVRYIGKSFNNTFEKWAEF